MSHSQRLFAISDIHIDYQENLNALLAISDSDYCRDTLVIAGDATDKLELLREFFTAITAKFAQVIFVPGNHELWLKRSSPPDSLAKFYAVIDLCEETGVLTGPALVGEQSRIHIIPLFSWYHTNEHPEQSLFMKKSAAEDKTFDMWSDFFVTEWPDQVKANIADYFLAMNESVLAQTYTDPIVSVSHFLPRQELMLSTEQERAASDLVYKDTHPEFNFSHVAGSRGIDRQLRQLGSRCHIYGHQHRNRQRVIDGVTYISHCMGYPKERNMGLVAQHCVRPLLIWHETQGFVV